MLISRDLHPPLPLSRCFWEHVSVISIDEAVALMGSDASSCEFACGNPQATCLDRGRQTRERHGETYKNRVFQLYISRNAHGADYGMVDCGSLSLIFVSAKACCGVVAMHRAE